MLLYDWDKIYKASGGSAVEVAKIVRTLVEKPLPRHIRDPILKYTEADFSGKSFLLHPELLVYNSYKHSYKDMAMYVSMASLRLWSKYLSDDCIELDFQSVPVETHTLMSYIYDNDLLGLKDGNIQFLYEDVENQTKH